MSKQVNVPLNFCDFQGFKQCLFPALQGLFPFHSGVLDAIYEAWKSDFNIPSGSLEADFVYCDQGVFTPGEPSTQTAYANSKLIGIDLPTLFTPDSGKLNKGCVMILGQDPLRKDVDFTNRSRPVVVGTPWALHSALARQGKGKGLAGVTRMWGIVQGVARENYSVYLTDIVKVWIEGQAGRRVSFQKADHERFIDLLSLEIDCIKPAKIVAMGTLAQKACRKLKLASNCVLELPHPSARANVWRKQLGRKNSDPITHQDQIDHIVKSVVRSLNSSKCNAGLTKPSSSGKAFVDVF